MRGRCDTLVEVKQYRGRKAARFAGRLWTEGLLGDDGLLDVFVGMNTRFFDPCRRWLGRDDLRRCDMEFVYDRVHREIRFRGLTSKAVRLINESPKRRAA
jgi:hypothetical protein